MSLNKNILGLIFANMHEDVIPELTRQRTMGSVLFGGRYRMIDFVLSSMTNSGVDEVGVVTKSNYQSLLDHLGSGREWDMARKIGGLHLLPPFSNIASGIYRGRLEALYGITDFIKCSAADYVIMSDCDVVASFDYDAIFEAHVKSGADITAVYARATLDQDAAVHSNIFGIDDNGRINNVLINPQLSGECNVALNTYIISKDLLVNIITDGAAKGHYSFAKTILQGRCNEFDIRAYEYKGYFSKITSIKTYYDANMALLSTENRKALFLENNPIYTKIRDNPPAKLAIGAKVRNSLVADGCIIEGTVENSILFRGVKVGKGSVVRNAIVMQDTCVGRNCTLDSVITDKQVIITDGKILTGSSNYPICIGKAAQI
ncbi:MAG: glucose-1-phosphate adenylyltransferase subunit GlgD [Oscillospiraceae bacterium]|nr:glucose-1-phosphate adenylyltransferase subunit GlgD [Oscillospiraceae bacterium]